MHVDQLQVREDLKEEIKYEIMNKVHVLLESFKKETQRELSIQMRTLLHSKDSISNSNSYSECFGRNGNRKLFPVTPEALQNAGRHLRRQTPNVATYGFISSTMLASARKERHQQVHQGSLITSEVLNETKEKIMRPSAGKEQQTVPSFVSMCTTSKEKSFLITPEVLMNRGRHLRRQTPKIATYEFISPKMVAIATAKSQYSGHSKFLGKEHGKEMVTSKMLIETKEKIFDSKQKLHFDLKHRDRKKCPITREALMNQSRRLQRQIPRVATYRVITPAMVVTAKKQRRILLQTEKPLICDKMLIEAKEKIMTGNNRHLRNEFSAREALLNSIRNSER
eukprot:Awhi_evm2s3056